MDSYEVGETVYITNDREGVIRFKGKVDGKNGILYGIELTVGKGKHNGTVQGKQYFSVKLYA